MLRPIKAQNLSNVSGVSHGFFTTEGGASGGIYGGLNCGFGSNDARNAVATNRARVAAHLCKSAQEVVTVFQVHGDGAVKLAAPPLSADLPKADAIVTTTRGLVIGVLTADCAPVLMADPDAGVVAAAHAGWRGAVSGIVHSTISAMEAAGASRSSIVAAVGPSIHQGNYEVGDAFRNDFLARDPSFDAYFKSLGPQNTQHFDLTGFVVSRLMVAGVTSVWAEAPCTYKNESLFFSYRRSRHRNEPDYGRQISAIVID